MTQHFLLVDDDANIQDLAGMYFSKWKKKGNDIELHLASQGEDAIEYLKDQQYKFELVIMDIRMPPGINGVDTILEMLKINSMLNYVFHSAFSDFSVEDIKKRLGIEEDPVIIEKPFLVKFLKKQYFTE